MSEFSGESPQSIREPNEISEAAKRRLDELSGEERVDPSIFGIPLEKARSVHEQFEKRIRAETDIERIIDDVLPPEVLFNPDLRLQSITTASGPVSIKRIGKIRLALQNAFYRLIDVPTSIAWFDPYSRSIGIV